MVLNSQSFATKFAAIGASTIVNVPFALPCYVHVLVVGREGQTSSLTGVEATFVLSNGIEITCRIPGMNSGFLADICTQEFSE